MTEQEAPCPMCLRKKHPDIPNSELRTLGATTETLCEPHRKDWEEFQLILNSSYQNTKGSFA
jgi:hypothetical protein